MLMDLAVAREKLPRNHRCQATSRFRMGGELGQACLGRFQTIQGFGYQVSVSDAGFESFKEFVMTGSSKEDFATFEETVKPAQMAAKNMSAVVGNLKGLFQFILRLFPRYVRSVRPAFGVFFRFLHDWSTPQFLNLCDQLWFPPALPHLSHTAEEKSNKSHRIVHNRSEATPRYVCAH